MKRITVGLIVGGIIILSGFAAGEELSAPKDAAQLERRVALLQREYRIRSHARALLSEVSLFDEGAIRGRSVLISASVLRGDPNGQEIFGPPKTADVKIGNESAGIGGSGEGPSGFTTDMEAVMAEIRALQRELREVRGGGR